MKGGALEQLGEQPGPTPSEPAPEPGNSLHEAIWALTSELSLDVVLQKVADLSRELVGASYSALGLLGPDGHLVQFITSGISQRGRVRIGRIPEGKGVLGLVLRSTKPIRLADLSDHPEAAGLPTHHPIMKSFLGVPIVFKGRVLGDLYLTNKIGAIEFSQDDENVVFLFAAQAAVAMENARLFDNEARRSTQLDGLNRIGNELPRILDLETLLQTVARLLLEGFDYQSVEVYWVDRSEGTVRLKALAGLAAGKVPLEIAWPLGTGLPGWVAANQQTVVCNDVTVEPRYSPLPGFDACAQLAVPVVVKDEVLAVISIQAMEPQVFDESDGKTLETLADQLAVAIGNVQLLDQQQEQSRRLAVAEERDRIGRDLHDGVIQSIYAVGLNLEDIASQAESQIASNSKERANGDLEELRERIGGVVADLNQVIGDIRNYIMDLRPRELQGRPLGEALASLIQYLKDRTGVSVELKSTLDLSSLSEAHTINLWHIFQEAFSNIEKYAKASKVTVSLETSNGHASGGHASGGHASGGHSSGDHLALNIFDNGVGFDPEQAELGRGYGLSNIKDRAERLGGTLSIDSAPGCGATIRVQFPLDGQPVHGQTGRSTRNGPQSSIEAPANSEKLPSPAPKSSAPRSSAPRSVKKPRRPAASRPSKRQSSKRDGQ